MKSAKIQGKPDIRTNKFALYLERNFYLLALLLFSVLIFFTFYRLGQLPARDWDEARHGVSAYEMMKSGNYIVNTYQYNTDYYNLKPPLSFWGVMLGYRLFGFTLFGMRFYSAVAFVLSAALTFFFCFKRYGKIEALCTLLFMACTSPFYRYHFARHADADSLFSLFVLISMLCLTVLEDWPPALYICSFTFSMAFLTKSWHALYVPVVAFILMLTRRLLLRLKPLQWCGFIAAGALPVLLWGAARFSQDGTRFLSQMIHVDLLNRTAQVLEGHAGGLFFYIGILFYRSLITGLLPITLMFLYAFFSIHKAIEFPDESKVKSDLPVILLWGVVPLILFSIARTKLSWYSIPMLYPITLFSGILFALMLQSKPKAMWGRVIASLLILLIVVPSFVRTYHETKPFYQDDLQELLHENRGPLSATAGSVAYIVAENAELYETGKQKYTLLGELYYDWRCKEGQVTDFLSDQQASVLIVSKSLYEKNAQALGALRTLSSSQNFWILAK